MGLNLSEDNAPCILSYKSRFGFRFLLTKQTFAHYTSTFNVIENVNDNEEWLNDAILMKYLHALAIEVYVCHVTNVVTLLFMLPYTSLKTG